MPSVINYKICDLAPECGGIDICPTGALFWNEKTKRPDINNSKCTSCKLCVGECPVGAIIVTRSKEEFKETLERIKSDPRSEKELWRERLNCQPGRTPPLVVIVIPKNFTQEVTQAKGWAVLDVWSEETLDCRHHSLLWEDLGVADKITLKKLDGGKYPKLAGKLGVTKFPTLLFFGDGREIGRWEGYIYSGDKQTIVKQIKELYSLRGRPALSNGFHTKILKLNPVTLTRKNPAETIHTSHNGVSRTL